MIRTDLIGNIGKDAEQKVIGGIPYASFSIAVTERQKSGENKTTWYRVMKTDKDGKLTPYLTKGTKVYVSGKPTISAYFNKNGEAVGDMTVWANNIELCSSKNDNQSNSQAYQQSQQPVQQMDNFPSQEDDLPF